MKIFLISQIIFVSFQTFIEGRFGRAYLPINNMKYKTGQAALFNYRGSIFTKLIKLYNKSNYGESKCTHAGIIAEVRGSQVFIYEPVNLKDGFMGYWYEKTALDEQIKEGKIIIATPNNYLTHVKDNCEKYEHVKYGILDIFSIGLFWLTGLKIKTTGAKRLICSEGVVRVLYDSSNKKIDFKKEFNKPYDLIAPMDIYISKQMKISK